MSASNKIVAEDGHRHKLLATQ